MDFLQMYPNGITLDHETYDAVIKTISRDVRVRSQDSECFVKLLYKFNKTLHLNYPLSWTHVRQNSWCIFAHWKMFEIIVVIHTNSIENFNLYLIFDISNFSLCGIFILTLTSSCFRPSDLPLYSTVLNKTNWTISYKLLFRTLLNVHELCNNFYLKNYKIFILNNELMNLLI